MIYVLLSNGASIVPFFLPGPPQILLIFFAIRALSKRGFPVSLPIISLIFGILCLMIFSIFQGHAEQGLKLVKLILNTCVAYVFAAGMIHRYGESFPYFYSRALLIFTTIGILGSVLTLFSDWHITFELGVRQYHTNLLTTWLTDAGYNSSSTFISPFPYRLQSLFDEPGTFGILLVPAFFYYVGNGKIKESFILLIGAFLTESANVWALCLIILIGKVCVLDSKLTKGLALLTLVTLLAVSAPLLVQLYEIKTGIDDAYAHSSSLDVRRLEFLYLLENWDQHLLPFQNLNAFNYFPNGISVSYVSWYMNGGLVFIFMLLIVFLAIIMAFLRFSRRRDLTCYFQMTLGLILILSGAQRSSLFDHILFMTLTFWVLLHKPIRLREVYAAAT